MIYYSPAEWAGGRLLSTEDLRELARGVAEVLNLPAAVLDKLLELAARAVRLGRGRVAVLLDDVFLAVGVDRAELLVKALPNFIEYPPRDYERVVVLAASSEGVGGLADTGGPG